MTVCPECHEQARRLSMPARPVEVREGPDHERVFRNSCRFILPSISIKPVKVKQALEVIPLVTLSNPLRFPNIKILSAGETTSLPQ